MNNRRGSANRNDGKKKKENLLSLDEAAAAVADPDGFRQGAIEEPGTWDILLAGRGQSCNRHPGNLRLKMLVMMYKEEHRQAYKREKTDIVRHVLHLVTNPAPPFHNGVFGAPRCRFLASDEKQKGLWFQVGKKASHEKVSQEFRNLKSGACGQNILAAWKMLSFNVLSSPCGALLSPAWGSNSERNSLEGLLQPCSYLPVDVGTECASLARAPRCVGYESLTGRGERSSSDLTAANLETQGFFINSMNPIVVDEDGAEDSQGFGSITSDEPSSGQSVAASLDAARDLCAPLFEDWDMDTCFDVETGSITADIASAS